MEESFVSLYAKDFVRMAARAELRPLEPSVLPKRMAEARVHAHVMDAKKGGGHLEALIVRLRDEACRPASSYRLAINLEAGRNRQLFLVSVADALSRPE